MEVEMMIPHHSKPMSTWVTEWLNRRLLQRLPRAMEAMEPRNHQEPRTNDRLCTSNRCHKGTPDVALAAALADMAWADHPLELTMCHRVCMRSHQAPIGVLAQDSVQVHMALTVSMT